MRDVVGDDQLRAGDGQPVDAAEPTPGQHPARRVEQHLAQPDPEVGWFVYRAAGHRISFADHRGVVTVADQPRTCWCGRAPGSADHSADGPATRCSPGCWRAPHRSGNNDRMTTASETAL